MSNSVLGIDIGNFNIKVVESVKRGNKTEVINYDVSKIPQNAINDGKVTDGQKLASTINNILTKNAIKTKNSVVVISSSAIITREVNIPKMKESEIEKYLQLDAQQYFPVNLEDYILDYKVLEEVPGKEGPEYLVLLVTVPRTIINDYMKVFDNLKLDLMAIDIEPNVVSNYINNLEQQKDKTIAVIDLGAQNTYVNIISKGTLQLSRMIPHGANGITRSIADTFNLKDHEAEEYKLKNGEIVLEAHGTEGLSQNISETIKPVVDGLASNINKLFEFYYSRDHINKIESLFLIGGGSLLKGIDGYYRSVFNIPTRKISPSDSIVDKTNKSAMKKDMSIILNALSATYKQVY